MWCPLKCVFFMNAKISLWIIPQISVLQPYLQHAFISSKQIPQYAIPIGNKNQNQLGHLDPFWCVIEIILSCSITSWHWKHCRERKALKHMVKTAQSITGSFFSCHQGHLRWEVYKDVLYPQEGSLSPCLNFSHLEEGLSEAHPGQDK